MRTIALEKVAKIDRNIATDEECATLPYIGLEHIEKDRGHLAANFSGHSETLLATKFRFTPKHVLYGKLRPYLNKVALPTFKGVCSTEILPLLPLEREIDRIYLWAVLQSPDFVAWASSNTSGANLPRLDPKLLVTYQLPLPTLPEQKRIAAILEKADRVRRLRRYALELSDSYLQAVFLEMFYQNANKDWSSASIESLAKRKKDAIRTGPFGSQLLHSEFVNNGIAVLGIDNAVQNRFSWGVRRFITEEKYQQLKRYTVFPGDVIITIMGTPGRCAVIPDNFPLAINTKHLCCITLDQEQCLPDYLKFCFLTHPSVLQQLNVSERGAVMPGLNMDIIKDLIVPRPPLPLQQKFVEIVHKFEQLQAQQREAERQAEHLFQTLLRQAFEGELGSGAETTYTASEKESFYYSPIEANSLSMPRKMVAEEAVQLSLPLD
jgi:type I restriction enzyme S subunit